VTKVIVALTHMRNWLQQGNRFSGYCNAESAEICFKYVPNYELKIKLDTIYNSSQYNNFKWSVWISQKFILHIVLLASLSLITAKIYTPQ